MNIRRKVIIGKNLFRLATCLSILTFAHSGINIANAAVQLPDAAKPGALSPQRKAPVPPEYKTPNIIVPPLIERPLDIEEGDKIKITDFVIEGAHDYPKLGIIVAEARAIVETEIGRYPDGITVGQLQVAADQVTNYYRKNGLIIAKAFIPEQTVVDGRVRITLLEGVLGRVKVEGNDRYPEKIIKQPFDKLIGKPLVKNSIESSLLTLMEYPGLSVTGLFSPGVEVGTADLTIKVEDENRFLGGLSFTNHGSEYVGEYQLRGDFTFNNVTRAADTLTVSVLQGFSPEKMTFGAFSYVRPISDKYKFGLEAGLNAFSIGQELEPLGIEGTSIYESAYLERVFLKSRKNNLKADFHLTGKQSESEVPGGTLSEDRLTIASFGLSGDKVLNLGKGGVSFFNLRYSHGIGDFLGSMEASNDTDSSRQGGSGEYAGAEFQKIEADYSHLQRLSSNSFALLRLQGQWSDDLLVSLEQFALGGPESVRAYSPSEYLLDSGYFASLEFFFKFPELGKQTPIFGKSLGDMLQFSVFVDHGGGSLNDPLITEDKNVDLTGIGAGIQIDFSNHLSADLTIATNIDSPDPENDRNPQIYFKMEYKF